MDQGKQMTDELRQTALEWYRNGYSVVPIEHRGKRPLVRWSLYANSPAPVPQLLRWFKNNLNMAVLCGGDKHLTVVDFDTQSGYYKMLTRVSDDVRGIIDRTYKVKTGRGVHVYFNVESRSRKNVEEKIDVKGDGGYVLVPPSLHPSGSVYTPMPESEICNIQRISTDLLCTIANISEAEQKEHRCADCGDYGSVFDVVGDDLGFMSDFDYVLANVPILRVALRLTPMFPKNGSGRYWMGRCPVHKDTDPSFWVDTELGIAKCYSTACQLNDKAVNAIGLWSMAKGISYVDAMHELLYMI